MSRLFWKFFVTFWLTLIAANVIVGVVIWLHRSAEIEQRTEPRFGQPPTFMLGLAAGLLQHEGEASLKQLLRDWQQSLPEPLYAVDAQGTDLLGRPVPTGALDKARQGIRDGQPGPWRLVERANTAPRGCVVPDRPRPPARVFGAAPGGRPPDAAHGDAPPPEHEPKPPLPWLLITTGLVASLAFSALLAWTIVGPIRRLRQGFRAVAAGRLETRLGREFAKRKDEIGELGQEFDAMAQQLEALMATQRRLFHDVSHELRSPLARLQAAVGLVHQDPSRIAGALERIERETQRLDEMVDELLTLARLDSGTSGPLADEIDLPALLHSIVDDAAFEAEAQGRSVDFQDRCGEAPAFIRGRPELLGRALENVIRNGIKYTAPGTRVTVEAERDGDSLRVRVADAGPGVPEAELDAIFVPFFRGADREQQRGYGLGLAIARRAIQAHGGSIRASNRPDGGLQVEIRLPLLPAEN